VCDIFMPVPGQRFADILHRVKHLWAGKPKVTAVVQYH
jgi:hypothetical protein